MTITIKKPLVSVKWLKQHLNAANLVILDASIPKVTGDDSNDDNKVQIPNARFFDLKNKFSDSSALFPTTFPSLEQFQREAQKLRINKDSAIVIYDDKGIYSSPRAWWLFKAFGHSNVAVLDGGLPAWNAAQYKVEPKQEIPTEAGDFIAKLQPNLMKFFDDVKKESVDAKHLIIDARSRGRFIGIEPEPRKGLRSGTIPNSKNLPFEDLLRDGKFKTEKVLLHSFKTVANTTDRITFSCGSGITACVLALGAELAGYKNLSVYDGSWTEWGTLVEE
ncbi:thiosulfate/3-mercaptopyruvate sulfurtransferase [Flavobacteriaceae bacterium MAR_2010_105]|nr:thiosulfate/3-mercaptopyruvate sulfurtransferase [Flavobacteriaceae bacterium MAR_2010_105]